MANYKYPKAGKNAPPGVKKEIENFHKKPDSFKATINLWQFLLGSSTQDYKMAQQDAAYVEKSTVPNQTCANCVFWYPQPATGRKVCSQIRGDNIKAQAWCRLWSNPKLEKAAKTDMDKILTQLAAVLEGTKRDDT